MDLDPCCKYHEGRVKELWDGRYGLTIEEILDLDIPIKDRGWAILAILEKRYPSRAAKLARMIALDVTHMWECCNIVWWWLITGDESSREAVKNIAWSYWRSASDAARFSTCCTLMDVTNEAAAIATIGSDTWNAAWVKYISWALELLPRD